MPSGVYPTNKGKHPVHEFKKGFIPWNKVPRAVVYCSHCGQKIELPKNRLGRNNYYCSINCRNSKIETECSVCGKVIKRQVSWFRRHKDAYCSRNCAKKTFIKKGSIPWNKNTKGVMKPNKGNFKKGLTPKNKLSIGSITLRKMHDGSTRKWIKVAEPNVWQLHSRYVYSQHEEITDGNIIHHKDRNPLNDDISNLEQMTKKQHMEEHRGEFVKYGN